MSEPNCSKFSDLLASYGLVQRVVGATHDAGGMLDVVCMRVDLPLLIVDVLDVGLSDHRLLRWSSQLNRPSPVYATSVRRCWSRFDPDVFQADLRTSALCNDQLLEQMDGDELAQLYDTTISQLLNRQVPARTVTCRRRPSSLWFDDECRRMKRSVRELERAVRHADRSAVDDLSSLASTRVSQRRLYSKLLE